MADKQLKKYKPAIGIECHVQLKTITKLFASVGNDARQAPPNSLISHICLGMPGALPVLNEKAVELATRMAFAVNTKPRLESFFERKHYFYPDLPKGYQITQLSHPIIIGGTVRIHSGKDQKIVRLNRIQIEEDAGKNVHPAGKDYSLVDLNRAGTPLLEVVSEPDISTANEAKEYAHELYLLVKYAGVSDADLFHGNMRFDVNVSLSSTAKLGVRTETKNLNSFRSVEKAVEYEIKRQTELLDKEKTVIQETRGWDDSKQKTFSQRGKEEAHDYRYMPEPDVPPIRLTEQYIDQIGSEMPVLPEQWRRRLRELGLDQSYINTLLEAEVENEDISYLSLVEQNLKNEVYAKQLANWFVNIEIPWRREGKIITNLKDAARIKIYDELHELVRASKISSTNAKQLLVELLNENTLTKNIEQYASKKDYLQQSNEAELRETVRLVIKENKTAVSDIQKGEAKAIGFLTGQVMKKTNGQANPRLVQSIIKKLLS